MLAFLLWVSLGSFVTKPLDYGIDYSPVEQVSTQQEQPLLEWFASRYEYQLWWKPWSKTHDTCALRIHERYKTYRVCTEDKCITCYHNDRGPWREDRVIDLSSHAFKQLAPLTRWLVYVKVYIDE